MEKLKRLRQKRELSQVKLAARADLNPATVNQIERGMRDASPGTLRKLADALGVSLYELLEEESPKVASPREQTVEPDAGRTDEVSEEVRRRFNYLAGGIERDVRRWEEWITEVRESADVPAPDPRTWARTIGLAAMGRYADAEAQGAVEALTPETERTPEGARLRAALDALLAVPQRAADASVGARQVSEVLKETEARAPEVLALEKLQRLAT